jgi:uncharacterized membrane protein YphA (DoxX/SURF4 family)
MAKLPLIARLLLGLFFTIFGLNGFLNFLPQPEMTGQAGEFLGALAATGYFFPFLKATETICGVLLLVGRFVPLALTVLAPVVLNILLFHGFLAPSGIVPGLVALVLGVYLAYAYRESFRGVLDANAKPS